MTSIEHNIGGLKVRVETVPEHSAALKVFMTWDTGGDEEKIDAASALLPEIFERCRDRLKEAYPGESLDVSRTKKDSSYLFSYRPSHIEGEGETRAGEMMKLLDHMLLQESFAHEIKPLLPDQSLDKARGFARSLAHMWSDCKEEDVIANLTEQLKHDYKDKNLPLADRRGRAGAIYDRTKKIGIIGSALDPATRATDLAHQNPSHYLPQRFGSPENPPWPPQEFGYPLAIRLETADGATLKFHVTGEQPFGNPDLSKLFETLNAATQNAGLPYMRQSHSTQNPQYSIYTFEYQRLNGYNNPEPASAEAALLFNRLAAAIEQQAEKNSGDFSGALHSVCDALLPLLASSLSLNNAIYFTQNNPASRSLHLDEPPRPKVREPRVKANDDTRPELKNEEALRAEIMRLTQNDDKITENVLAAARNFDPRGNTEEEREEKKNTLSRALSSTLMPRYGDNAALVAEILCGKIMEAYNYGTRNRSKF